MPDIIQTLLTNAFIVLNGKKQNGDIKSCVKTKSIPIHYLVHYTYPPHFIWENVSNNNKKCWWHKHIHTFCYQCHSSSLIDTNITCHAKLHLSVMMENDNSLVSEISLFCYIGNEGVISDATLDTQISKENKHSTQQANHSGSINMYFINVPRKNNVLHLNGSLLPSCQTCLNTYAI